MRRFMVSSLFEGRAQFKRSQEQKYKTEKKKQIVDARIVYKS